MTRETKIGLLVGLCFIIVIGILLSDHFRATMDPPQAALVDVGDNVRDTVTSPAGNTPPVRFVQPRDVQPREPVKTRDELSSPPSPVTLRRAGEPRGAGPAGNAPAGGTYTQPPVALTDTPPGPTHTPPIPQSLADAARAHGMDVVPVDLSGRPIAGATGASAAGTATAGAAVAGMQEYKAESGDTVSKLAARFLGANTKINRDLIIKANPTLQSNPDRIIVGQSYIIPAAAAPVAAAAPSGSAAAAPAPPPAPVAQAPAPTAATADADVYTVQAGDNLWRIARDQLGNPGLVDTLKDLNSDVLKGDNKDTVIPGMKLRLPTKAVATAR